MLSRAAALGTWRKTYPRPRIPAYTSCHLVLSKGRSHEASWNGTRCGARGLVSQDLHSGGAGAPPGTNTRPCQELADIRGILLMPDKKRGPALDKRCCGAPRGARRGPVEGSRTPLVLRLSARHSPLGERLQQTRADSRRGDAHARQILTRHARTCSGHPLGRCGK
jgi:hypothetical protein